MRAVPLNRPAVGDLQATPSRQVRKRHERAGRSVSLMPVVAIRRAFREESPQGRPHIPGQPPRGLVQTDPGRRTRAASSPSNSRQRVLSALSMSWASPAFSFGGMRHIFRSHGSIPFLPESAPPFPSTGPSPDSLSVNRARRASTPSVTRRPRSREGTSAPRRRARRDMSFRPVTCPLFCLARPRNPGLDRDCRGTAEDEGPCRVCLAERHGGERRRCKQSFQQWWSTRQKIICPFK